MAGVPCMERLRMAHGLAGSEDWECKLGVRRGRAEGAVRKGRASWRCKAWGALPQELCGGACYVLPVS